MLKDKDVEKLVRWIEKEMEELKRSLREHFHQLKFDLKRDDWWAIITDAEYMSEDASQLIILERVKEKLEEVLEE